MTEDEIRDGVARRPWFHHIDLGHGIITPGAGGPGYEHARQEAADICFGMGVEGRSVLDIGAFDGFNAFAAERKGDGKAPAASSRLITLSGTTASAAATASIASDSPTQHFNRMSNNALSTYLT